jgi:hypothetical protein
MEKIKAKQLPEHERKKIRTDLEKNYRCPRLLPDPPSIHLPSQNFALVSCISPFSGTQNADWQEVDKFLTTRRFSKIAKIQLMKMIHEKVKFLVKIRGAFPSEADAIAFAEQRIGPSEGIECFTIPMYEYGFYPPSQYADPDKCTKHYADKEAQKFYRQQRLKKEEDARCFQRRLELFRQEVKENNENYEKLSQDEKDLILEKERNEVETIEGVEVSKILQNETFQKVMTKDTFDTIRKIGDHMGISYDKIYEAWAEMRALEKQQRENPPEKPQEGSTSKDGITSVDMVI